MTPNQLRIANRNRDIYDRVYNGESYVDVARDYGITPERVGQIYRKMWGEHCAMATYEKVRETSGLNHLVQIGREKYRGDCHLPNGKVKTKEFKYDRAEAKERWLAWVEEVELDWEERHETPDEDDATTRIVEQNPVRAALVTEPEPKPEPEYTTTWSGPAVATVSTSEPVVEVIGVVDEPAAQRLYLLHRVDWQGRPTLFYDCDKALGVAANLSKLVGCEFDVTEVGFWEEG